MKKLGTKVKEMNEMINRGFDHIGEAYQNHFDMLKKAIATEHEELNRMQVLAWASFFQEQRIPESYISRINSELYEQLRKIINLPFNTPVGVIEEMEIDLVQEIMEAE